MATFLSLDPPKSPLKRGTLRIFLAPLFLMGTLRIFPVFRFPPFEGGLGGISYGAKVSGLS